jgi:hypothetical protein
MVMEYAKLAREIALVSSKISRLTVKVGTGYSDRDRQRRLLKRNL